VRVCEQRVAPVSCLVTIIVTLALALTVTGRVKVIVGGVKGSNVRVPSVRSMAAGAGEDGGGVAAATTRDSLRRMGVDSKPVVRVGVGVEVGTGCGVPASLLVRGVGSD